YEAREHLERGRLARAVGPQEPHELALAYRERDVVRGRGLVVCPVEQALHAAPEAWQLPVGAEDPREVFDFDHRSNDQSTTDSLDRTKLREIQQGVADEAGVQGRAVGQGLVGGRVVAQ